MSVNHCRHLHDATRGWGHVGQIARGAACVDDVAIHPGLRVVAAVGLDASQLAESDDESFRSIYERFACQPHEIGRRSSAIPRLNQQFTTVACGARKHDWHTLGNRAASGVLHMENHMLTHMERKAVQLNVERFLAAVPHHLALSRQGTRRRGVHRNAIDGSEVACVGLGDLAVLNEFASC